MKNARRPIEKILVAKTDGSTGQAVLADGTTRLTNQTTGVTNLAAGQLGIFDGTGEGTNTINVAISAGDTVNDSPAILIAQGTSQSATPAAFTSQGFFARTYEASLVRGRNITAWRGQARRAGTLAAWTIGADAGQTDAILPLDSTEFAFTIAKIGRRQEFENSARMRQSVNVRYTTPDYTTLGTADSLDHLVQNLVYNANRLSYLHRTGGRRGNEPFVAFAIDTDNSTATAGSVQISGITAGTTTINGVVITAAMEAAFDAIAADANVPDIDASSRIVPVDRTTAGNGTTASCQAIVILSLDELTAYEPTGEVGKYDRMPQLKTNLDIGLTEGFNSDAVLKIESQRADEGEGSSRQWVIYWRATDGQRQYHTNRTLYPVLDPINYLVDGETYDAYIIQHYDVEPNAVASEYKEPMKTIILVPDSDTTTKNQLEAVLNPYIQSGPGLPYVNI